MSLFEKNNKYFISDSAYVFKAHINKDEAFAKHKHDFVEMVYIIKGNCTHTIDGRNYSAKSGDLVIINYNQTHRISGAEETTYVNILLKPEYISRNLVNQENAFAVLHLVEFEDFRKILNESRCKISFSGSERKQIETALNTIICEMEEKSAGHELIIHSYLNVLITMVFRKLSLNLDDRFNCVSEKLLSYITRHCTEKITLESVAEMCSYAPSYFCRLFKNYTGETFTSYLKKARIKKAADLILSTNNKITDIAFFVGYTDKTKFFAHFKSIMGVSPLKYRKM